MANEETAFREVDQELAEERQWEMFRKRGPVVVAGALAIVAGVAAWQFWNMRQTSIAEVQALEFNNAVELLAEDQTDGRTALGAVAEEGGGFGVLAQFHQAASFARGGERLRAIEIYRDIYGAGGVSKRVRELARLRASYLSLSDNREQVLKDLGDLPESEGAFAVYAREVAALAALGAEDYETSLSMFRQLSVDIAAPPALRQRAEDFAALAASGKAGVNISGDARVEDLIEALGEAVEAPGETGADAPVLGAEGAGPNEAGAETDSHEGHDHEDVTVDESETE